MRYTLQDVNKSRWSPVHEQWSYCILALNRLYKHIQLRGTVLFPVHSSPKRRNRNRFAHFSITMFDAEENAHDGIMNLLADFEYSCQIESTSWLVSVGMRHGGRLSSCPLRCVALMRWLISCWAVVSNTKFFSVHKRFPVPLHI